VFTDRALSVIYEYSKGVPRMINVLSDYALMAGFLEETKEISEKIVLRAIHEMSGAENEQSTDSSVENDRIEEPTAMTV